MATMWNGLKAFANNVFEPKLHVLFAAIWSLSLLGNIAALGDDSVWQFGVTTPLLVGSFFLVLFFLRMVDEVKDFDYDKIYNPGRPLVAGLIGRDQLRIWMVLFVGTVLTINFSIHKVLGILLALDMAYGLFLILLEKCSKAVQDKIFVNLAVTYPVNFTLSIYTLLYYLYHFNHSINLSQCVLLVAYATAFLHFEIARKSGWPHLTPAGERLYSHDIGPWGALALSLLLGIMAVSLLIIVFSPWNDHGLQAFFGWCPILAWVPMTIGSFQFIQNKNTRHKPRPMAVAYLMAFYVVALLHALVATHWQFSLYA